MIRRLIAVMAITMLAACGGGDHSGTGGLGTATVTDTANPTDIVLTATPTTVAPGQEIQYECQRFDMPATQTAVTKISPAYGTGTHHLDLFQVLLGTENQGSWMCPEVIKATWAPLFVGGTNPDPLVVPTGYGLVLPAGLEVVLQRHLLNTTPTDDDATASVTLSTTTDPVQPTGGFGFESTMFTVPALTTGYQVTTTCAAPIDLHFWAGFGHAHKLATSVDVSVNGTNVFHEPWSFTNQPHIPVAFDVKAGDVMTLTCTYDNPGPNPVSYGTSTTDEMCAWLGHRYPYPGFAGCIDGNPVAF